MLMIKREFWIKKIEDAWERRSIVWLAGVRRVGKTYLCKSLPAIEYYNCELPRVKEQLQDPEHFYMSAGKRIILDEIHVLDDPSIVLKIAADEFPETKIVATGSSTLGARKKFSDTLTGRKVNIHLTSMLEQEGELFGNSSLHHRFLYGGLPPFFLSDELIEEDYAEWFSSYFARDVQKLYNVENIEAFIKFAQLIQKESGGIFDATRFAQLCGISRPTAKKYLHIVEQTYVSRIVRPFSSHSSTEIIKAPKVYAFDTGFICFARGILELTKNDYGELWECFVLNNLIGYFQQAIGIHYWRDKSGHEIDFVVKKNRNKEPIAIECKWNHQKFEGVNLKSFRNRYPGGRNFVVAANVTESFEKRFGDLVVTFVSLKELLKQL